VLIVKNLLRRRVRTFLSVLGIAIGVAAIIAFNAVARGFHESINRYMRESGAQMLVVNKTMKDVAFSRISKEEQDFVRALPEVEHLSPATLAIASPRGLKVRAGKVEALVVFGRTPGDRLLDKFRGRLEGRSLAAEDEVMVGAIAARSLGLKVGDVLEMFRGTFRIVGIYESPVPWENSGAVLPNAVIQREMEMGESVYMGFLYLRPGADWREAKRKIEERYDRLGAMRTEEFTAFYDQIEYIDWFVWIITLVSLVVGGLGVLNTMLMSVSERTREIGTLRALGWSRPRVLRLILLEGILMSVAGGLAGLAIGAAGAEFLIRWAPQGFLGTHYSAPLFARAFAVAMGLGFVGALYPAWQASRLSPIEALKYE
jgi:putative ABC transport system permease protein